MATLIPSPSIRQVLINGLRVKADSDMRYQAMKNGEALDNPAAGIGDDSVYVVNTSGSIMKNKKNLKDTDDMYYCTDKQGHVVNYSDEKCSGDNECAYHKAN